MLSCLFCFGVYYGETIYKFFYIMESCGHLVCAVELIFKFHKALSIQVAN